MRRRLLDLYCGEGGSGEGFRQAGFDVYGVDLNDDWTDRRTRPRPLPLKLYPFPQVEGDAIDVLVALIAGERIEFSNGEILGLEDFAAINASPPCQLHTRLKHLAKVQRVQAPGHEPPELVGPTRDLLEATGLPWVIENVEGAPLAEDSLLLCGSMFEPPLDVRRHRLFETNWPLEPPPWPCRHKLWAPRYRSADYRGRKSGRLMTVVPVYGGSRYKGDGELRKCVMEMPWASAHGVCEAIPPRYTEFIGRRLLEHLTVGVEAA